MFRERVLDAWGDFPIGLSLDEPGIPEIFKNIRK
jgi:hypothetical protein